MIRQCSGDSGLTFEPSLFRFMTITWYGQSCFKLETREAILAIDPFSKDIGLAPPRFHADIVLVTHHHADHDNTAVIAGRNGEPKIIDGPGEYEMNGLAVTGIPTFHDEHGGKERGANTVFRIETEGISIVHLGDFGESSLREETAEGLGDVDILLIPVGGVFTIDAGTAAKIANQIEPRIVIPMHYRLPNLKIKLGAVGDFLKEYGAAGAERLDKLNVKKKDLPQEKTRTIALNPA